MTCIRKGKVRVRAGNKSLVVIRLKSPAIKSISKIERYDSTGYTTWRPFGRPGGAPNKHDRIALLDNK